MKYPIKLNEKLHIDVNNLPDEVLKQLICNILNERAEKEYNLNTDLFTVIIYVTISNQNKDEEWTTLYFYPHVRNLDFSFEEKCDILCIDIHSITVL